MRTDKVSIVRSMVFAVGIPRLQAGEDVKLDQILVAAKRAADNPEDVPPRTRCERVADWLRAFWSRM